MTSRLLPEHLQSLLHGLDQDGYAVLPDFFPAAQIQALADDARQLQQAGAMHLAGTGHNASSSPPGGQEIRGDFIHWLENTPEHGESSISQVQQDYLDTMETMRSALNQHFYLGLFDLESHFAIYPPGAVYRKHLDQFQDSRQRQVSCILYLNQDWQPEFGGQLRLYLNGVASEPYVDIMPQAGTLVAFLSARFWHEVIPAKRERISLTGWLRTRAEGVA